MEGGETVLTRPEKREIVEGLSSKIKVSPVIVLVNYRGLNVEKISDFRRQLLENKGHLQICKNTLIKVAVREAEKENEEISNLLQGPNAILYVEEDGDPMACLKTLVKFAKDNDMPEIKGGLFEGEFYDAEGIRELSKLPSREELLGMLANVLQAPIQGVAGALNNIILKLPYAINAVIDKKENE